ncbi:50S ribosomal protein L24 [Blattabacterium cuenoti]|uniref:50S ribosomal protein L24 n=1 Tax=Blattabacterium cuenoti TaxID=1653831 RepID=UPI00163D2D85|nr:50S ribosomal protein L24 [Blattabacterium cuenoti]
MKRIKKKDKVLILNGDYKGHTGIVLRVYPKKNRVIIDKINMVTKHRKPNAKNPKGEILKKEASIHISNLTIVK